MKILLHVNICLALFWKNFCLLLESGLQISPVMDCVKIVRIWSSSKISRNHCKYLIICVSIFVLNGTLTAFARTFILFTFLFIAKICSHIDK